MTRSTETETRTSTRQAWLAATVLVLVVLATIIAGMMYGPPASGQTVNRHGSCWAQGEHPQSERAYRCQVRGWRIARHVVVNPHGVVRTKVRPCSTDEGEEGRSCYWNARTMGNGRGVSYVYIAADDDVWYGIVRINGVNAIGKP